VEVTVINNDPGLPGSDVPTTKWSGKIHELEHDAEAIGRNISRQLGHLTAKAQETVSPPRRSSYTQEKQKEGEEGEKRPAVEDESAIADEDDEEEGWASEGSKEPAPGPRASTSDGKRVARSSSRSTKGLHLPHTTHRPRRRGSIRRNSSAAADSVEPELRGRPATTGDVGVTFASPQRTSRPATAPSSSRIGAGTARSSRPGTAESSLRHHRLESIRALHGSTRDSSPSRSVRFVDEEGRAGSRVALADLSGRTFADSPAAEEGWTTPPTSILEPSSKCP
jgi:hypothetical protein